VHALQGLESLGERKIIQIIQQQLEVMPGLPLGFGDDVSALKLEEDNLLVLKTDMLVDKTDVPPGMSLWQAARKAVVMNISDLAAKGAKPIALLVALGIPRGFTEKDIKQIAKGLNSGAREYNTFVLGGDTNEASDLIISCAVLGTCHPEMLIKRKGTRPGDILAVTGNFGKTAAGLKILLENIHVPQELRGTLLESILMPKARLKEGLALASSQAVTASIDSSDGLAWSLHELSKASHVGFLIEKLPLDTEAAKFAKAHGLNPTELCLYGGEEYELVLTIKPQFWNKALSAVKNVGGKLIPIGKAIKENIVKLKTEKGLIPIEFKGWEHFKTTLKETQE
jgi:thiamine-monophosphate kinase